MSAIVSTDYHQFSLASLARRGSDRARFEAWCEDNAPRVASGGESYNDLLDRLDGSTWRVSSDHRHIDQKTLDLPTSFSDPVWLRMRSILASIVRELRR